MFSRSILSRSVLSCVLTASTLGSAAGQGPEHEFVYKDIENFRKAFAAIEAGDDPLEAVRRYFRSGTLGLKAYLEIYDLEPERLAEGIGKRPRYFKSLLEMDTRIRAQEQVMLQGFKELLEIYPEPYGAVLPKTYFFITNLAGGGTPRPIGALIGVDYFGRTPDIDLSEFPKGLVPHGQHPMVSVKSVAHVVVHEMAHHLQKAMQGWLDYVSIYRQPRKGRFSPTLSAKVGRNFSPS